ncbi:hypothetical protein EDF59_110155 [Novosphingobium sp. ST904]|nr:hypothetical protein EDF59_110155 [Novosphingobium sp. ST904]
MKAPRKACIVCGRPVPRRSTDVPVIAPSSDFNHHYGSRVHADLKTLADCRRHTNMPYVISALKSPDGFIIRFTEWDGESYHNGGWFCTNRCAMAQGFAAAQHGQRYVWKDR